MAVVPKGSDVYRSALVVAHSLLAFVYCAVIEKQYAPDLFWMFSLKLQLHPEVHWLSHLLLSDLPKSSTLDNLQSLLSVLAAMVVSQSCSFLEAMVVLGELSLKPTLLPWCSVLFCAAQRLQRSLFAFDRNDGTKLVARNRELYRVRNDQSIVDVLTTQRKNILSFS